MADNPFTPPRKAAPMPNPMRVPEAVREAVRSVLLKWLPGPFSNDLLDAFADPVLTAALKAEWDGPWRVWCKDVGDDKIAYRWMVDRKGMDADPFEFPSEAEARAVCAALNITQGGER